MTFLQRLANTGIHSAKNSFDRRSIILSNGISVTIFCLGIFLFLAYYWWYGWSFVTASIPVVSFLCLGTIVLNRFGLSTISKIILCLMIPVATLFISVYAKTIYYDRQEELDYFTFRFIMLSTCVFPAVFFSFAEKRNLFATTAAGFLLLMFHDPIHSLFDVPYDNHRLKTNNYYFTNVVLFVSYLIIVGTIFFLKKISEDSEQTAACLIKDLNEKNHQLFQQNSEIEAQKSEIQAQTENLNLSQKRLQDAYSLIEEQKDQLVKLNAELSNEVVKINRDLTATNNELIKHNNELRQFSYTVSHNLRGPVASLSGLVNLIDKARLSEETAEIFNHISTSIARLETVIKDLNQIIDIRNDIFHVRRKIDIRREVEQVLEELKKEIDLHNITIHTGFRESEIYSVKPMIHSILYNLISNAIKYHSQERDPEITIRSVMRDNYIAIEVQDNGLGIDLKNQKENIFKLYKRFHFHTEGKGLGLYLVKLQTEALGGFIEVDSVVNHYTKFTVSVPVSDNVTQQLLYQSPHATIFYDAKINSTGVIWAGPVPSEQYKDIFAKCLEFVKSYNTPNYIADLSRQGYIAREDQHWMFNNILPEAARHGLRRIATITPDGDDPESSGYHSGIRETVRKLGIEQQFFTSFETAFAWVEANNEKPVNS